ncbi:carboxypeptidase M32 [Thiotrichales bacterium 19S9-12]|nr:carboxypeptidase M32 [Thiotrichales bacterium 19S9-11]MCF6810895.1 carboxypeptidase M32 [Thiotrichales bacterium 19S9-12]
MSLKNYQKIEDHFKKLRYLENANQILSWDEQTMMPVGGSESRNESLAYLSSLIHKKIASDHLDELIHTVDERLLDNWQKANFKWIKKRHTDAKIIPDSLVTEFTLNQKQSEQAWRKLKDKNNWQDFKPFLDKTLQSVKKIAQIKGDYYNLSSYDVLLDDYSPGIRSNQVDLIFSQLKDQLPKLLTQILKKQASVKLIDFKQKFPIEKQQALAKELMEIIGFDFDYGRVDTAIHPFCGGTKKDIRITARYNEDEFISSVMAICHETGHAMYELQLPSKWQYQPVGDALGMSVHESQSLLVEMHASRSYEFMRVLSKLLEKYFGSNKAFEAENLYQHYRLVRPGLIRVDADEVTYPLHVILRYELEKALINDEISLDDLAYLWDEKMKAYLNLDTKGDYKNTVMQDVHWPAGLFGYFPAYALGSLLASQLYESALSAKPNIPESIGLSNFSPLMTWLKTHIHSKASLLDFNSLVEQATAKPFSADSYLEHIKKRYLS